MRCTTGSSAVGSHNPSASGRRLPPSANPSDRSASSRFTALVGAWACERRLAAEPLHGGGKHIAGPGYVVVGMAAADEDTLIALQATPVGGTGVAPGPARRHCRLPLFHPM
ncbi:DUF6207 family protein [Streptomyces sp. NPDC051987]|uniref:DUF6207 family protein n=1 Tax=Streptomyces sp. NPDC051987 TaxID=3155808 RepID=UPI003441A5FF